MRSPSASRISCNEQCCWLLLVGWSALITCFVSLLALLRVSEELQIDLSASMLQLGERVSVSLTCETLSLFQLFKTPNRIIRTPIEQRNRFAQMCLLHRNLPHSLRPQAAGPNMNQSSGHT